MGGGTYGGIGEYPKHMGELKEQKDNRQAQTKKTNKRLRGPVFRPGGSSATVRTPSVMAMKLNRM